MESREKGENDCGDEGGVSRKRQRALPKGQRRRDDGRGDREKQACRDNTDCDWSDSESGPASEGSVSQSPSMPSSSPPSSWTEETHRAFVSSVFAIGLKHSSPSALMEIMGLSATKARTVAVAKSGPMTTGPAGSDPAKNSSAASVLTVERVKSHLQKYRINKDKSRGEFLASYDTAMERLAEGHQVGSWELATPSPALVAPAVREEEMQGYLGRPVRKLRSGEAAAVLTRETMAAEERGVRGGGVTRWTDTTVTSAVAARDITPSLPLLSPFAGPPGGTGGAGWTALPLPALTDHESRTPLGTSIQLMTGLARSLREELLRSREESLIGSTAAEASMAGASEALSSSASVPVPIAPAPQVLEAERRRNP